jgi:3-oxoacyl-[acyl-carrier-protein] synthase II
MNRRVVITGIGVVSPLGTGKDAFSQGLYAGACGIRPIASFDTSRFESKLGAEVQGFNPQNHIRPATMRRMDRLSQMLTAAARMALDDAGLSVCSDKRDRVGVVLGTCFGGTDVATQFGKVLFTDSPRRVNPILVPNTVMNAPAGHTAIELGVRGVNTTVNHREVSAETALAYAAAEIMRGRADAVLAGGGDMLSEFQFNVLTHFKTLSPRNGAEEKLRPFDRQRNGTVVGEGAGVVCLESLQQAEARGAVPYCEIAGWGSSSAPAAPNDWPTDPAGPLLAMTRAIGAAGITAADIDYLCASANGGLRLDRLEADALVRLFSDSGYRPALTALKGALGENFSSGGLRAAAMALTLRNHHLAPIVGLNQSIADLNFARTPEAQTPVRYGLIHGISSGGTCAALVMKAID